MATSKNVIILEDQKSPWIPFLKEVFEDTSSQVHFCHDTASTAFQLDKKRPDVVFTSSPFLSPAVAQKLKVLKQSAANFRMFFLGTDSPQKGFQFDDCFDEPLNLVSFQKRFTQHLPLPDRIRVLVADDEAEIGMMMRDFLEHRVQPSFEVQYVENGKKALEVVDQKKHDVLVLDIKMPEMDGREVYRILKKRKDPLPVIIFFDAISGDEMTEVRKFGTPAVVEKGGRESAMPEMMALIKKLVYFG